MKFLGLEIHPQNMPELDPTYVPLSLFFKEHQKLATQPFAVAIGRTEGQVSVYETKTIGTDEYFDADKYYIDRLVKFLLWSRGGYKITLCGDKKLGEIIHKAYSANGTRAFDKDFMQNVYEKDFTVEVLPYENRPSPCENSQSVGGNLGGCRIGFDAGGSDYKVSAVVDGNPVFSEETVWFPKENSDPDYHYKRIMLALRAASAKMPRVDAIGVSSAGVFINNRCMVASLFNKVNEEDFKLKVHDIYLRAAKELGDIPVEVANDGDVTALAGAMSLNDNGILGIAMGTSEAVGYVDTQGNITGWLNELAFAPVDGQPNSTEDEWSGDIGCGVKYFSQDSVIRLAKTAGITMGGASLAEKLKDVQALMQNDDPRAIAIYRTIGVYLGHSLSLYSLFYDIKHVLLLGRVLSGKGGDIIIETATNVMKQEYPEVNFAPETPDEKFRRVGQSIAAASLPQI